MASSIHKIAIVGVAGTIGTHITTSLLSKNRFAITAISRHDSTATFPSGIQVARIDYNNHDGLTEALKGHDALIITTSVFAPKDTSAKLIRAAAAAGVPWILPNEFGMYNTDEAAKDTIGTSKKEDRELIESLGVSSWVGVSCGFWYEHSLSNGELYGIDIGKQEVTFFDDGTQKLNTSTWTQVGRAVAALLSLPVGTDGETGGALTLSAYQNRMVYISSFAVNQKEMFESVKRVTSTTDEDWKIKSEPAKERVQNARARMNAGERRAFGQLMYTRYFYEDAGLFEKTHGLDNDKLGLPSEDLDEATKGAVSLVENGYWKKYGL